jgi:RNA polymerase sigma factor (sigma-70 family)
MNYSSNESIKLMSDRELIEGYRSSSDKQWVGELYKRYAHLVMAMCLNYFRDRDLAKDTTLQIFEKLFVELQKREVENFKAWLTFVVRNHCISEIRKRQTLQQREEEYRKDLEVLTSKEEETEEPAPEKLQQLESALQALNPFQKKCIELFYYKNMSYSQIVEHTGFSAREVKSYIQNGKRNLKLLLTELK